MGRRRATATATHLAIRPSRRASSAHGDARGCRERHACSPRGVLDRRHHQRDLYDLPLTTTADAATHYREAQERLLKVQVGAEAPLRSAVAPDPDFALGHATLALLGMTSTCDVDTRPHLRPPCDRRLEPPIGSAASSTSSPRASAATSDHQARLLRHIAEHPRDALALNIAVPTIAFSGVGRGARAGVGVGRGGTSGVRLGLVVRRPAGVRPSGAGPLRRGRRARHRRAGRRAGGRARGARARPRRSTRPVGTPRACAGSTAGSPTTGHHVPPVPLLVARRPARAGTRRRDGRAAPVCTRARTDIGAGRPRAGRLGVAAVAGPARRLVAGCAADRRRAVSGRRGAAGASHRRRSSRCTPRWLSPPGGDAVGLAAARPHGQRSTAGRTIGVSSSPSRRPWQRSWTTTPTARLRSCCA